GRDRGSRRPGTQPAAVAVPACHLISQPGKAKNPVPRPRRGQERGDRPLRVEAHGPDLQPGGARPDPRGPASGSPREEHYVSIRPPYEPQRNPTREQIRLPVQGGSLRGDSPGWPALRTPPRTGWPRTPPANENDAGPRLPGHDQAASAPRSLYG